jgi:hypothetical protein
MFHFHTWYNITLRLISNSPAIIPGGEICDCANYMLKHLQTTRPPRLHMQKQPNVFQHFHAGQIVCLSSFVAMVLICFGFTLVLDDIET